jgi:hypothetical protein
MEQELTSIAGPQVGQAEIASTASANGPDVWDQIVNSFRQACILKQAGKLYESNHILRDELPQTIASWSRRNPLPSDRQAEALRHMFEVEQQRIRDLWKSQEAMAQCLTHKVLQTLSRVVGQEIKSLVASQLGLGNADLFRNSRNLLLARSHGPYKRVGPRKEMWDEARWNNHPASPRSQRLSFDDIPGPIDVVLGQQQARVPAASH